jgi:arginine utilization protein RocB
MLELENAIYQLMLELASIPSVSESAQEESGIARFIRDRLRAEPYFRDHPDDLRLLPCEHDPLGRSCLFAMVRAEKPTARTVLLTGHLDVVDAEAYGPLRELAFDPEALTARIGELDLSPEARSDLESGDWLFGRGVADMRYGLALEIVYLLNAARNRAALPSNVALLLVPDEEANSRGMIDAVPHLRRMQDAGEARFLACINTEPTVGSEAEAGPTIYTGSIGKVNLFFFCLGRETHLGEYYQGLSAAPIASRINLTLDGNPEYSDRLDGSIYPPYGCLRQHDLREEYSASVMTKAAAFYSHLTVGKLPKEILTEIRAVARQALQETVDQHAAFAERFAASRGRPHTAPRRQPQVFSFAELRRYAEERTGTDVSAAAERLAGEAPAQLDLRDAAIRLVEQLVDSSGLRGPLAVVGFLPPFYPHRLGSAVPAHQQQLNEILRAAALESESGFARPVVFRAVFEGVSDLSYCGFKEGAAALAPLADNLPGWGQNYIIPLEDLSALDIPVANIGPVGRDAHKASERLYLPYALRELPSLLDRAVRSIGEKMEL